MDTSNIKNYSIWARRALREGVAQQAHRWHIAMDWEGQPGNRQDDLLAVDGVPLSDQEKRMRAQLLERIDREGYDTFVEEAAYTWFARFIAIRYMEVNGLLPSRTCIFSAGSLEDLADPHPLALREAATLDIPGLDRGRVLDLIEAGNDEALFREILLAECNELAACLPDVFEPLGAADELILPTGLLSPTSVTSKLVTNIPAEEWTRGVEILGSMYQYYITEKKDEVFAGFKKKKKAETVNEIGPATQLFTPEWIVHYMVENSLGRLWMLNNPQSDLRDKMEYYIEPEGQTEDFIRINGPEDITLMDPACGSGHILAYAFDLLMAMYEERGYLPRDAAQLIVEKNLSGLEIDPRAGQYAVMALTFKAREHDRRLFDRGVRPNITVLESVTFTDEELARLPQLAGYKSDIDTLAHLSEAGSLYTPADGFTEALAAAAASLGAASLDDKVLGEKIARARKACEALSRKTLVTCGNPPYMGSSSFGTWLSAWTKKNYPDSKSDLCTMFIERNFDFIVTKGYSAQITMQSWMFLGSYEKLREKMLASKGLIAMAHLGARGFDSIAGEVVSTTAFVAYNGAFSGRGTYVRLVDDAGEQVKADKYLAAVANPNGCGNFYRADATNFKSIPGTPIAYWASEAMVAAFGEHACLGDHTRLGAGITTGNSSRFMRMWWEIANAKLNKRCLSTKEVSKQTEWYPCNKGGQFRRWYGNREAVLDYSLLAQNQMSGLAGFRPVNEKLQFNNAISWSDITSDINTFRLNGAGCLYEHAGSFAICCEESRNYILGLLNSSVSAAALNMINPTLNCNAGVVSKVPFVSEDCFDGGLVEQLLTLSRKDYDSQETSWDFKRNPLV